MDNGQYLYHTLMPLTDFKAVLGIDDREDCLDFASARNPGHEFLHGKNSANSFQPPSLAAFCLITATCTIEQYCKRRLLRRKRFEFLPFYGDYLFPLRDYPVREIELCYAQLYVVYQTRALKEAIIVEPDLYHTIPGCGELEDIPFCLSVSPALPLVRDLSGLKVHYRAGYVPGKVPADLASACLELAAWNMARYRGRRIGMTGNIRGSGFATRGGADGEHLETSMPENVRALLEPYKRRMV
jgi:hypothetical protein